MPSRYDSRPIIINDTEQYKNVLRDKKLNLIKHYVTPILSYPTPEEINQLQTIGRTWAVGDRFYKLAFEYYGDAELWWIIAQYNQTPTEAHVKIGDTIFIPLPLEKVLEFFGV